MWQTILLNLLHDHLENEGSITVDEFEQMKYDAEIETMRAQRTLERDYSCNV